MTRRSLFHPDPALLLVALLAGLAAWPFLVRSSLPVFTDTEQHVYRTFEVLAAWRAGTPFIRWAPDLFHGFGYPVFNYYAPLSYYLGAAYGWVFAPASGAAVAGVKFVYVVAAGLGALGSFLLARRWWDSLAGVIAAAAFVLSPYLVAIEPHALGHAPESLALALLPLAVWAFDRARHAPGPGNVALAALLLAAMLLAHNLVAPIGLALLLAWLVWAAWTEGLARRAAWNGPGDRQPSRLEPARRAPRAGSAAAPLAALLLALALVAFFWLPALLERDAVQLDNATASPYLDYRANFVSLDDLLKPATPNDVLGLGPLAFRLGLPQWALAAVGLVALAVRRRGGRLFWGLAGLGLLFFVLPQSRLVWGALPQLALLQFPWRLLGPLAFVLTVLAAAAVGETAGIVGPQVRLALAAGAATAFVLAAWPLVKPLPWADFGPVTPQRIHKAQLEWAVGTTATNEFLPAQVAAVPAPQPSLVESYEAGEVDKLNRATLPAGAEVALIRHLPEADDFVASSPADFTFRVFTFDFPGWTAYVGGRRVPITPSEPEGWITFPVPAGSHNVSVRLEDTWPRRAGEALSLAAGAVSVILVGYSLARRAWQRPSAQPASYPLSPSALPWRQSAALSAVLVVGLGASTVVTFRPPLARGPVAAELESHVALAGYTVKPTSLESGDTLQVVLHWQAAGPVTANSRVFVHAIGPDGEAWAVSDKFHPGEYEDLPTGRWPVGYQLTDGHTLSLPPEAPAGTYRLLVGLWDGYSGKRLQVLGADGAPSGADSILLAQTIEVVP